MGQYIHMGPVGRGIVMYYTPFAKLFGELTESEAMEKLRHFYRHEFRHHLEFLAGESELEIEDSEAIREYLERGKQGN